MTDKVPALRLVATLNDYVTSGRLTPDEAQPLIDGLQRLEAARRSAGGLQTALNTATTRLHHVSATLTEIVEVVDFYERSEVRTRIGYDRMLSVVRRVAMRQPVGQVVTLDDVSNVSHVSVWQATVILNITREHVLTLVHRGTLSASLINGSPMVERDSLERHLRLDDSRRTKAINELSRLGEEMRQSGDDDE